MKAGIRIWGRAVTAAIAAALVLAIPVGAGADSGDQASAATKRGSCLGSAGSRNLGADYVYKLRANFSCDRAKKLTKQFHQCRHDNGGWNGKCPSIKGFSCSQKKLDSSPTLYQAKARCEKGGKKFKNVFGESH